MRGAKLFLEACHRQGIQKAFGIVGGEAQAIRFNEVEGLDFYLTRHEFAAGIMADAYARLTGRPQIAYSTFGPGMTNLTTGVSSALLDRAPMLAVSAQVARAEMVYGQASGCLDSVAVMTPLCKFAHQLDSLEEIPKVVAEALRVAKSEVPGPSFLSFPMDLMREAIDDARALKLLDAMPGSDPPPLPAPDPKQLEALAAQLAAAEHPIALAGNLVVREHASAELRAFVDRWQIPLITSNASKGILPEAHPLHVGTVDKFLDGILHHAVLDETFGECDLILLLGYDFAEGVKPIQWKRGKPIRSLWLSPNPNRLGKTFQPDREVIGSLKLALPMLAEMAPRQQRTPEVERIRQLKDRKAKAGEQPWQSYPTIPVPAIVRSVRAILGADGILCSDTGLHRQYASLFSATDNPNTFLCSSGAGTFGFGFPAAMGAKIAMPEQRVAVICGDGGFHSTSQDLETAVRYNLPMVIVLLKDNSMGLVKYHQLTDENSVHANTVDFGDVNFCALAEANGWEAAFVTSRTMLEDKMAEAFNRNRPTLLELPVRYQYKFDAPGD